MVGSGVVAQQPDIILLDYGSLTTLKDLKRGDNPQQSLFRSIHQRVLLIAAGGHKPSFMEPTMAGARNMVTLSGRLTRVLEHWLARR